MENSTKYCLTAIIIMIIWSLSQPIGGSMSISANLSQVPYFNLTNSTISGSAEISGHMPVGAIIPMFISEGISTIDESEMMILLKAVAMLLTLQAISILIYTLYEGIIKKHKKE